MKIIQWVLLNKTKAIAAVSGILVGLLGIAELIPGNQGEEAFKSAISFLASLAGF